MGLILPQTVKVRTSGPNCKHFREKGYEFEKCGDFIEVNVLDLPKGSNIKVKVACDICGKITETRYSRVVECNKQNELIICTSNSCKNKKSEDTCIKKYGVKHPMQCKEIQKKKKKTCQLHHGVDYPMQCKIIQEKSQQTWQKSYGEGIINPMQAQEVKDRQRKTWQKNYGKYITSSFQVESVKEKSKQTMLNNYGVEYAMQNEEIQNKVKATNLERHGVEHAMQNEEIKNKALDSFQFHGTGPSSRAQRYINHILNGILNKHICGLLADIYIEKENIVIEHDGAGHFLIDKFNGNKTPTKESLLYEKEREDKIINNGYRMIRFIATKDRIPSDEVILNLIEGFKNSDFKVIRINFEEGTIDRDYEEKWHCNFGKLRKITKEDLEKFENNNDRLEN